MEKTLQSKRAEVDDLCRRFAVERLEVFGSAATGELREDSDVDLLVAFHRVESMSPADQYFGRLSELEKLFGRRVDLLTLRSLRNPYLIDSIEKTRELLYAA